MKVLMIKDVGGVGQRGIVKEVSDGYALNFLIPKGLAVQATPEKVAAHQKQMEERAKESEATNKELVEKLRKLNGTTIRIQAKANEKGHLFKKIHKTDIADAISFIDPDMIQDFGDDILDIGAYVIHLAGAGVEATVNLVVDAN